MHVWCGRLIKKQILSYSITFLFIGIAFSGCLDDSSSSSSETEGWIDPFMFHSALKSKAIELGAEFIKGEVKSISEINAKTIVSAAGCWTKELLEDIPVVPQKHTVFSCLLYTSPSPRD